MTYDNPLRPSGHEAFDVGTVIEYEDGESGITYEYLGKFATDKHVVRSREDGVLYETYSPAEYRVHVDKPKTGTRWGRKKAPGEATIVVRGHFDLDDGAGVHVVYNFEGDGPRYTRSLTEFARFYEAL